MKYILIGGSGFIGQHFKKCLGNKIILNLDINEGINNNQYSFCNILDEISIDEKINENEEICLIHLAAVHFDFQKNYYETNVEGTKNVLNFISKNKRISKYVFFSSVATYGDSINGKNEKSKQLPYNDYGKSKLLAEKIILDWNKRNSFTKIIIVRPAVVYGEYNFGNVYNFLKQISNGFFAIIGSGKNIKSIAYAPNLVDSVIYAVNNIHDKIFIYNYSDYPQMTITEQSNKLCELMDKSKPIKFPYFLTRFITLPIDILEKIFRKDLKFNSMRVKKFTIPTNFNSDLIRSKGFKQKYTIEKGYKNTLKWISTTHNINELREKWYKNASKL
jgi:nucleoside-diphosphate-sugar epimerase